MGAGGTGRGVGPPDGSWGWAVLGACFVVTGFAYGFPKAVSVFFRALMRDFGAGYSDMAWVSSIMLAMLYGTGQCALPRPRTGMRIRDQETLNPLRISRGPLGRTRKPFLPVGRLAPERGEEREGRGQQPEVEPAPRWLP